MPLVDGSKNAVIQKRQTRRSQTSSIQSLLDKRCTVEDATSAANMGLRNQLLTDKNQAIVE